MSSRRLTFRRPNITTHLIYYYLGFVERGAELALEIQTMRKSLIYGILRPITAYYAIFFKKPRAPAHPPLRAEQAYRDRRYRCVRSPRPGREWFFVVCGSAAEAEGFVSRCSAASPRSGLRKAAGVG